MCDSSFINSISKFQRNWLQSNNSNVPQHWTRWLLPCLDWLETSELDCPWPPIFGASGIDKGYGREHPLQHINNVVPYTLRMLTRWPGALDCSFAFYDCFLFLMSVPAPLCASAQLVVLKSLLQTLKNRSRIPFLPIPIFSSSLSLLPCPFPSHPGIGLHVNMEGGGHLDAR